MPAIPITSDEQQIKIIEVLHRLGGSWQWVGGDKQYLYATPTQYQALLDAKAITPLANGKDHRGKKSRKKPES
jgi:hypothetical protein